MQDISENETIQLVMECSVQLNKNYELPTLYQVFLLSTMETDLNKTQLLSSSNFAYSRNS